MYINVERITPCSVYDYHDGISKNPIEAWNSRRFKELRKAHFSGKVEQLPDVCKKCINRSRSMRHDMDVRHPEIIDDIYKYYENDTGEMPISMIRELSYGPSNSCNIACITCSKQHSNTYDRIYEDAVRDNTYLNENLIFSTKGIVKCNFDFPKYFELIKNNVKYLYLQGGEPTLSNEIYNILKMIDKKSRIIIVYSTNGTVKKFPNGISVFDAVKDFINIEFTISIDGIGKRLSYIRYLQNEKKIFDFIKRTNKEMPNVRTIAHFTISNLSVIGLIETVRKFTELIKSKTINITAMLINPVTYPEIYRPYNLPNEVKERVMNDIISFIKENRNNWPNFLEIEQFNHILKLLLTEKYDKGLWEDFLTKQKKMDERRSVNILDTFPELENYV